MLSIRRLILALAALVALPLHAQTYNLFKPANGILKGQTTTYVTTAAAASDVISLWSGTCNASTFLKGDGSCAATSTSFPLLGTNGSAGAPTYSFSVSPTTGLFHVGGGVLGIAAGGTTAMTLQNNLIVNNLYTGFPATSTAAASINMPHGTAPTSPNNGDLWTTTAGLFVRINGSTVGPLANGTGSVTSVNAAGSGIFSFTGGPVTGSGTLTLAQAGTSGGVPYFSNGTTLASSAALAANQIVLGGGAGTTPATLGTLGTTTTVLHGNAGGAPTFGAVSLSADVTGTLADGSLSANVPLLNAVNSFTAAQSFSTTATTLSTFNSTNADGGFLRFARNGTTHLFVGNAKAIAGGTLDDGQIYSNQNLLLNAASGDVRIVGTAITGPSGVDMTPAAGTFVASFVTACTTTPTVTFNYERQGNIVTIRAASTSGFPCTGDSASFITADGDVPVALRPTGSRVRSAVISNFSDSGTDTFGTIDITTDGAVQYQKCSSTTCGVSWTASGNRSAAGATNSFTYGLGNP